MATNVCLAIIADSPARLVVGTYPAHLGLLFGSDQPNRAAGMIEAWDFDRDAGVLRVVPAPGPDAQERQVPLASLINLSWGSNSPWGSSWDEQLFFQVSLFFDDGGRHSFLNLPGSADFLCAWSDQAREMEHRLRALLKPLCPRLESTTLETLVKFWRDPVEGIKSLQERVGTRLAALDNLSRPPESSGASPPELDEVPGPAAPARELLTQLQSALGQLSEAAADRQKKRAEAGGQLGGCARQILILLVIGLGFLIGLWLFPK
ncbi:MAG TPA: hypothetical protein VG013_25600 [Gemmataceae bacterium]|jgi:hypothetical protein|nr:hypothetical protein [Gemmataceae bacterium]